MSEIELLGLIVGGVLAMFASVLSYLLYTSKKDKKDNHKKITTLEKKIEGLQTKIEQKNTDIIRAYEASGYIKKTYDIVQKTHELMVKHYNKYDINSKKIIKK